MANFKKLVVWQKSKDLAVKVYSLTESGPLSKDYGLKDQLRRAAVSIPSNIAEGDSLDTNKQSIKHFFISRGSGAELRTQLIIANEIGYFEKTECYILEKECDEISGMLTSLINHRKNNMGKRS